MTTVHLVVRCICLVLLFIVGVKQIIEYRRHDNGVKKLRLKLIGSTGTFFVFALAATVFQAKLIGLLNFVQAEVIYTAVTMALVLGTFTWFYIYFVKGD